MAVQRRPLVHPTAVLIFEKPSISLKRRLSFETRHVSNGAFRFRVLERDHGSRVDTDDVHFRLGQVGGERERERERAREREREREGERERTGYEPLGQQSGGEAALPGGPPPRRIAAELGTCQVRACLLFRTQSKSRRPVKVTFSRSFWGGRNLRGSKKDSREEVDDEVDQRQPPDRCRGSELSMLFGPADRSGGG